MGKHQRTLRTRSTRFSLQSAAVINQKRGGGGRSANKKNKKVFVRNIYPYDEDKRWTTLPDMTGCRILSEGWNPKEKKPTCKILIVDRQNQPMRIDEEPTEKVLRCANYLYSEYRLHTVTKPTSEENDNSHIWGAENKRYINNIIVEEFKRFIIGDGGEGMPTISEARALTLDGVDLYTSRLWQSELGFGPENVYVPNAFIFGDILKNMGSNNMIDAIPCVTRQMLSEWIETFGTFSLQKLVMAFLDYCCTFGGNAGNPSRNIPPCRPKEDLSNLFRNMVMADRSLLGVTVTLRDPKGTNAVENPAEELPIYVQRLAASNGFRCVVLRAEKYGKNMLFCLFGLVRSHNASPTEEGEEENNQDRGGEDMEEKVKGQEDAIITTRNVRCECTCQCQCQCEGIFHMAEKEQARWADEFANINRQELCKFAAEEEDPEGCPKIFDRDPERGSGRGCGAGVVVAPAKKVTSLWINFLQEAGVGGFRHRIEERKLLKQLCKKSARHPVKGLTYLHGKRQFAIEPTDAAKLEVVDKIARAIGLNGSSDVETEISSKSIMASASDEGQQLFSLLEEAKIIFDTRQSRSQTPLEKAIGLRRVKDEINIILRHFHGGHLAMTRKIDHRSKKDKAEKTQWSKLTYFYKLSLPK